MKKIGILLFVLILPMMLFGAASRDTASEESYLRFAWWGNPTRDERTEAVVRLFEQKNPGVKIETETSLFAGYWDNLAAQAAAGNLPDVMQQDYAYIEQYNNRNMLVDLTPFAQRGLINLSNWSDAALAGGRLDGKLIGLSLGTNAWGMEADQGVLQRAGVTINDTSWTWREFEQAALQIHQRTGVQTMPMNEHYQIIENLVRYFGASMYSRDGRSLGFTTNIAALAALRELLDMHIRLKNAGALYDPEDGFIQRGVAEVVMVAGKTWNNWNWSNQHVAYVAAANRPLNFFVCPAPAATGMKAPFGTYLKPSMLISILSTSKNQELAARFVDFMANDVDANRILLAERGVPLPTHILADLAPRVDPNMRYTFDYITRATTVSSAINPPDPARAGEARDAMRPILLNCLIGRIAPEAAVAQMVAAANVILSR
jgi:multiple sugar transport system substrate-binding protein